jgi:hypothetical protein
MVKKTKKKTRKLSQKTTDWAIGLPLDFPKPKRQSRKREQKGRSRPNLNPPSIGGG